MNANPTSAHKSSLATQQADRLVHAAQQGEPGAFDALVRAYRPRVLALGLHITGSLSDADDVAQEVFLRAYHHMAGFEGRSHFFTWLYRIALNQALNCRRRRPRLAADDARVDAALEVDAVDDPRRALELRETYGLLLQGLDALSPKLRAVVVLVALQGLSYRETAVILETTEGTIAWRLNRARLRLRETMELVERRPGQARALRSARLAELLRLFPRLAAEPI